MSTLNVAGAAPDPIFALAAKCREDPCPKKADLGIGAYRDNDGKPWVLPVVRKVEKILADDPKMNHEYSPLAGLKDFYDAGARLVFGEDADISKIGSCQTLSGTGANHMGALLLRHYPPFGVKDSVMWVPNPTWGNHYQVFQTAGFQVNKYPYWDAEKRQIDFDGLINCLKNDTKKGDIIVLHACAHNPTGMDPTRDQWKVICEVIKEKKLFAFFDCAYQGFASGDIDRDAWAIRYFVQQKVDLLVCQSFSKNMGLYGERCGALHVCLHDASPEVAQKITSQVAYQTRGEVSTTPAFGARVAHRILTTPELYEQWKSEVKFMADRIIEMRHALRSRLEELKTPGTWKHITEQIGMFSFIGLPEDQCRRLVDEFHVYLLPNSRVSVAGVNTHNVNYIAESIHTVVTQPK